MANQRLPCGSEFLKKTGISYLRKCHKKEKDPKARERLLVYIMRKEGLSIRQIAARTNRCYSIIRYWLVRAVTDGLKGRYDIRREGRECLLNGEQIRELLKDVDAGPDKCGFETKLWNSKLVAAHIEKKFGVSYTTRAVRYLLVRYGFSWRKLRPRHPKSPTKPVIKAFKKKARRMARKYRKMGYTILTVDECTIMIGNNGPRYGWQRRGTKKTAEVSLSRQKKHVFGALTVADFSFRFSNKQNSRVFLEFLRQLYRKFGPILVFVDNASWHTSAFIRKALEEFDGEVKLAFYPPYAPELNAEETQWNTMRNAIGNRVYKDTTEMVRSIRTMIRKRVIVPVEMSSYLVP